MKTLVLSGYGKYLGTEKFDFAIKKNGELVSTKPFHSVKEIEISSGRERWKYNKETEKRNEEYKETGCFRECRPGRK